jgi:hypothetical protein
MKHDWDVQVGKIFKDALGTRLHVNEIDEKLQWVYYTTNYDDKVRTATMRHFRKWIKEEVKTQ